MKRKIVAIYRSRRKEGAYVYIEKDHPVDQLPEELRAALGGLELAMTLLLTPEKKLAQADSVKVMDAIDDQGFYLQMPPAAESYMHQIPNDKLPSSPI